jgi:DNA segregation ATPase FtsK/SpoIIIE, S-DNA-T family
MTEAERMVADGLREVQRRQTLLGKLKREGKIIEGRTSPELARAGLGLHPLILVFDEVHELFLWSKQAVEDMIRLIKQGRSAGVIVILITQVAGKDSVPTEVTRCVSSRWCMSVADQVANDQIMGTGAYKRGLSGTPYRPEVDAGWGVTDGMAGVYRGAARAYYPDGKELAVLLERIAALRSNGGPVTVVDDQQRRNIIADVLAVLNTGEAGAHWEVIAERLADLDAAYYGVTAEVVSARIRAEGVESVDVKMRGQRTARKGARRADLQSALHRMQTAQAGRG